MVRKAIDRMRTRRAYDHEGLVAEHFIHARDILADFLERAMYEGSPDTWSLSTIVPIFKGLERAGMRVVGQAGFRRGFSTLDHILTLRAIIEEGRSHGRRIYCNFVDFRKAFDIVPRERLMRKLQEMGVPIEMTWGIMALYRSVRGQVRTPEGLSDVVHSTIGVK